MMRVYGRLMGALILSALALPALAQDASPKADGKEAKDEVRFRGRTLTQIIAELEGEDPQARQRAAFALKRLGKKAAPGIPALVKALADDSPTLRNLAAQALSTMGAQAEPPLRAALSAKSAVQRASAAHALELLGAAGRPSAPALLRGLKDSDAAVRRRCAEALGAMGPNSAAIAPLAALARDGDAAAARAGAEALGRMGVEAGAAALGLLAEEKPELRSRGLTALRLGAGDAKTFAAVRSALKDKDAQVKISAALAMPRYRSAEAALALIEAGQERGSNLSAACVSGLIRLGSTALKPLEQALAAKEKGRRGLAVEALDQLCRVDIAALPLLMKALNDKDQGLRQSAILALTRVAQDLDELGEHRAPLVKAFKAILDKEKESDEALDAIEDALGVLGG